MGAVLAPPIVYLLYPLKGEVEGYSKDQFVDDSVHECANDIRGSLEAGARRVSTDFITGRLAAKNHSRNLWTRAKLLEIY